MRWFFIFSLITTLAFVQGADSVLVGFESESNLVKTVVDNTSFEDEPSLPTLSLASFTLVANDGELWHPVVAAMVSTPYSPHCPRAPPAV